MTSDPLRINQDLDTDAGAYSLGEVITNLRSCPFIRQMLNSMGYEGWEMGSRIEELQRVRVALKDEDGWTGHSDTISVPRGAFLGGEAEELASAFIHEIFHIIDGTYPDDSEYFENRCEVKAVREEVAYLRYLGREDAWIEEYLRQAHAEARVEDRLEELMLPPG